MVPSLNGGAKNISVARSRLMARMVDSYANVLIFRMFGSHGLNRKGIKDSIDENTFSTQTQMRNVTKISFFITLANSTLITANIALGLYLWRYSQLSVAEFALVITLTGLLYNTSINIMWKTNTLLDSFGSIEGALSSLAPDSGQLNTPSLQNAHIKFGSIELSNVYFGYELSRPILTNVTMSITEGETLAIVGPSGGGKSTIVNLILGIYQPQSGYIEIGGHDVSLYSYHGILAAISGVTQDTSLLDDTLRNNLLVARPEASDEQLWAALDLACASDFVHNLVDSEGREGLDMRVGERGASMSGGQRQRICIARAFLKPSLLLILDEATSALDSITEQAVMRNLLLEHRRTMVMVSHRLSPIRNFNRIAVVEDGRITQIGTHEELLSSNKFYRATWKQQTGATVA